MQQAGTRFLFPHPQVSHRQPASQPGGSGARGSSQPSCTAGRTNDWPRGQDWLCFELLHREPARRGSCVTWPAPLGSGGGGGREPLCSAPSSAPICGFERLCSIIDCLSVI